MDRHYHWDDNIWLRTILQFGLGIGLVSLASFFLVFLYFRAFGRDIMASGYTKYELPFSMALLTILNLFYVVYYFWIKWQWVKAEQEFHLINEPESKTPAIYQIMVYKGATVIPLQIDDIANICKVENTMLVYTFDREQYVTDKTLEELEQRLDSGSFFRLNRQLIVHISCCKKYELLDYGKLMVTIEPESPVSAIVSQRKAPLFRRWMTENIQIG
ncbi:LytTr DNA-binding domain protein [compost metagenome]